MIFIFIGLAVLTGWYQNWCLCSGKVCELSVSVWGRERERERERKCLRLCVFEEKERDGGGIEQKEQLHICCVKEQNGK